MCHFDRHSLQTNVICRVCPGNNSANCFCKPSTFSDMPQILSGTESLVLTWEVCFHKRSGKSRKSKCCTVVPFGFYLFWRRNWEKVKDGGESKGRKEGRKEGGRKGGGPLKNAACVTMATRKTTRGWSRPPSSNRLLLLLLFSIHFTIWCHFQLINLPVFHKQHFCEWLFFLFKGTKVSVQRSCSSF